MKTDDKFLLELGKKIEKLYLDHEDFKTQADFSGKVGVDVRTIRRIIKGQQNPTILVLKKISKALGINLQDLFN